MYHAIVRRHIPALFTAINQSDAEPVLASFARRFEHAFLGEHALGGARHTLAATRRWYERLYRLLPDIHFACNRSRSAVRPGIPPSWSTRTRPIRAPTAPAPPIAASMSRICAGVG